MPYLLLLSLFVAHWLGDYSPLQTARMLRAKALGRPLLPIAAHAAVHTTLMAAVLLVLVPGPGVGPALVLQAVSHFGIDALKGRLNGWFPALRDPTRQSHWVVFGFDQMLHHAVIVAMVALATHV